MELHHNTNHREGFATGIITRKDQKVEPQTNDTWAMRWNACVLRRFILHGAQCFNHNGKPRRKLWRHTPCGSSPYCG